MITSITFEDIDPSTLTNEDHIERYNLLSSPISYMNVIQNNMKYLNSKTYHDKFYVQIFHIVFSSLLLYFVITIFYSFMGYIIISIL